MRKKKSDNKQKLPGYEPKFSNSSFAVFDDFNTKNVETFWNDDIGSQLVYFFLSNFSEIYQQNISGVYKKEVELVIAELLWKYEENNK